MSPSAEMTGLRLIRDALQLSAHALAHDAFQLPAQMAGRLLGLEEPAVSVQDRLLRLWRLADGVLQTTFHGEGEFWVSALAPDGRTLVTGDRYGRVDVFRLNALEAGVSVAGHRAR